MRCWSTRDCNWREGERIGEERRGDKMRGDEGSGDERR